MPQKIIISFFGNMSTFDKFWLFYEAIDAYSISIFHEWLFFCWPASQSLPPPVPPPLLLLTRSSTSIFMTTFIYIPSIWFFCLTNTFFWILALWLPRLRWISQYGQSFFCLMNLQGSQMFWSLTGTKSGGWSEIFTDRVRPPVSRVDISNNK